MYSAFVHFYTAHTALFATLLTLVGLPAAGAVVNRWTWFETTEKWVAFQKSNPRTAALIRISRSLLPHLLKAYLASKGLKMPKDTGGGDDPTDPGAGVKDAPVEPAKPPSKPPAGLLNRGIEYTVRIRYVLEAAPSLALFVVMVLAMLFSASGCGSKPPQGAQDVAYRATYTVARAVKLADQICADATVAQHDATLGDRCAKAYGLARGGLLGVEAILDAWQPGLDGELGCAASHALDGLMRFAAVLTEAKVPIPPIVTSAMQDAAKLATFALGTCQTPPPFLDGGAADSSDAADAAVGG